MENATKALYMAAGVFIGVLILTAMIFVFRQGGQMLETLDNNNNTLAIEKFNSELIIYNRPGTAESYNTIFDIVTACNLAYDINRQNDFDNENCVIITLVTKTKGTFILDIMEEKGKIAGEKLTDLIKYYGEREEKTAVDGSIYYDYKYIFSGIVDYNTNNRKINSIVFEEV